MEIKTLKSVCGIMTPWAFLRKFVAFTIPLGIMLSVWCLFLFYQDFKSYVNGIRLSEDVDWVVVGDSQSRNSLNPQEIPHLVNFSSDGMSLDQLLYKVRDIIAYNRDRDFSIILNISPVRLRQPIHPMPMDCFEGRYVFLNMLHFFDSVRPLSAPLLLVRDRFLFPRSHAYFRRNTKKRKGVFLNNCIGDYYSHSQSLFLDSPCVVNNSSRKFAQRFSNYKEDGTSERLYKKIIGEIASNGRGVILYVAPWHSNLIDQVKKEIAEFREKFNQLKSGLMYFDCLEFHFEDENSFFYNENHLNSKGAKVISRAFKEVLENQKNKKGL